MSNMSKENQNVGVEGFRLALKIGELLQAEKATGAGAMFALAATAAYGIRTQRARELANELETLILHTETVSAILNGDFNDLLEMASEMEDKSEGLTTATD